VRLAFVLPISHRLTLERSNRGPARIPPGGRGGEEEEEEERAIYRIIAFMPPIKLRYALDRKRKVGAMAGLRFYVCLLRGDDSEHLGTRFYADCATARPPAIRNPRPRANVKIGKFFPNEMKSAAATPPCLSRRKHCVAHCVLFFLSSFCSGPLTGRGREGYNRETGWIERITRPQIGQKAQKNERKGFSNVLFLLPILPPPPPPPPPPPSPSVGRSVPAGGSDVARRRENPSI